MLTHGLIGELDVTPFVFPMDLEMRLRRAVSGQDMGEYRKCLEILKNACTGAACQPREIRDACIRFFMTMIQAFKDYKGAVEGSFAQEYLRNLSVSNTWDAVMEILISFFEQNTAPEIEKEDVQTDLSPLVQKARALIQEYYCQGITLEETARRLRVSDEYLSTQFKKETGKSFTETVRAYRVEKIKKLLRESNLKLNQIAAMTGYSDPKYMSKVFREEVGMLPAEYRKK